LARDGKVRIVIAYQLPAALIIDAIAVEGEFIGPVTFGGKVSVSDF
jgi:hypothetical protein